MTITSSPPMRTSPMVTTVSSGLKVRLASLYGSVMRSTSCTPSSMLDELRVDLVRADDAEHRARRAGRAVHVHAQLDQPRDDRVDLRLGGAFFHYDDHDAHSHCLPDGLPRRTPPLGSATPVATLGLLAFGAARLVDDAFEDPHDGFAVSGPASSVAACRTCASTCASRSGW